LVALLYLFSATSFAEVCLTDAEAEELETIFDELQTQLETQRQELTESRAALTKASDDMTILQKALQAVKNSLTEAEKSLRKLKVDSVILTVAAGVGGFLIGYGIRAAVGGSIELFTDAVEAMENQ
jgi:septal ring factor EnvC (AmiA/AmiB activator)